MDLIQIDEDYIEPLVILDESKGLFRIEGKSLLVNAEKFYRPIINWWKEYVKNPQENTVFILAFEYLNSSSVRQIVEMLVVLEEICKKDKSVIIKWLYNKNDDMIQEKGEEIKSVVFLPFEIEEKK